MSLALRLSAGIVLGIGTAQAVFSPEIPLAAKLAAVVVMALTAWRPTAGLVAVISLAPAGLLLAASPARAAEVLTWAFLSTWLLCMWRPLGRGANGSLALTGLYAACVAVSWVGYTVRTAAGIEPLWLPVTLGRALSASHLVYTSPEPETFTLLPLAAGLALFAAAATLTRENASARRAIATALAASAALFGVLTVADVARQWAGAGYTADYLLRYVRGERFSFHLADLNAAGSLYVLGGLVAIALASVERQRRLLWIGLLALMLPALYLSGSRSAVLGALIAGGAVIVLVRRDVVPRIAPAHAFTLALVLGGAGVAVLAASGGSSEQGTVSNSLWLRSQFLVTSARMFASAPVFGVGIGHYHERSNEFMPPALRAVYRYENAHNYFAQQFAELGAVGGTLFLALVSAVLWHAWRQTHRAGVLDAVSLALLAACVGYLLTCVTGHPLLVPEAALPFWAAFGALAATAAPVRVPRAAVALVALLLAVALAIDVRRFSTATTQPGERGFYGLETGADGRTFVWMTQHGVFYERPQPGTLVVPVRAPEFAAGGEPFRMQIEVGGRRAGIYETQPGSWTEIEIPIRDRASGPFRRIDLRVNRAWTPKQVQGSNDERPRSVMIGETRFVVAGSR